MRLDLNLRLRIYVDGQLAYRSKAGNLHFGSGGVEKIKDLHQIGRINIICWIKQQRT